MHMLRRKFLLPALAGGCVLLLAGCAGVAPPVDIAIRQTLAPTGTLRVGVYLGSPTSMVRDLRTGEKAGLETEALVSQSTFLTQVAQQTWKSEFSFGGWTQAHTRQFQTLTHPGHLGEVFRVLVQKRPDDPGPG